MTFLSSNWQQNSPKAAHAIENVEEEGRRESSRQTSERLSRTDTRQPSIRARHTSERLARTDTLQNLFSLDT